MLQCEYRAEKGGKTVSVNLPAEEIMMKDSAVRNVLFTIDKGYVCHMRVTLRSLVRSNGDKKFNVYVMSSDLVEQDIVALKQEFGDCVKFNIITMNDEEFAGFPTDKRYPVAVYYRIFAPILINDDIDRLFYLDCDTIVRGDVDLIYNQDFCGNYYIGCTQIRNILRYFNAMRLKVDKNFVYLNTGVVVMNVRELRKALNVEEIKRFTVKNKRKMILYDQDIIYKFFGDKIKLADTRKFNLSDRRVRIENSRIDGEGKIDSAWIDENAVILHYLGKNKPWKSSYRGVLKKYYDDYKDEPLQDGNSAAACDDGEV